MTGVGVGDRTASTGLGTEAGSTGRCAAGAGACACACADAYGLGGKGVAQPISARDREIAEALGPILMARGLMLVGLDIIGDSLTEINVTSPTCFQEITDQMGCDVAALFWDAVEAAL
jgi:hypothetical protein